MPVSIPVFLLLANSMLALLFIVLGGATRSAFFFLLLAMLLWASSLMASTFVWWSWLERESADKWAIYGILNISVPLLASNTAATVLAVMVAALRRVRSGFFLHALIAFLAFQLLVSFLAA